MQKIKKIFPLIILLISISLIGIIFLQALWIKNATIVSENKYNQEIHNAMNGIKDGILQRATQFYGYNPAVVDYENPTVQNLLWDQLALIPTTDIEKIIKRALHKNNNNNEFSYAISKGSYFIHSSKDFNQHLVKSAVKYPLNYDNTINLYLFVEEPTNILLERNGAIIVLSLIFTAVIITAFFLTIKTIFQQKKMSEITTDFINNMTHEFKTPIATINIALDTLNNPRMQAKPEMINFYTNMIKEENKRMHILVQRILETAKMEKNSGLEIQFKDKNINHIIEHAVASVSLLLQDQNGQISMNLYQPDPIIPIDEVHFTNVINNLLDNAIKYSKPGVPTEISIYSYINDKQQYVIKIKDNGIGMSKDNIKNAFERFYRAGTGNLHNVKGFGLGLSYVKSVIDALKGKIYITSIPLKGATFTIELPMQNLHI